MYFNTNKTLEEKLVGKTLTNLEYGVNQSGCQTVTLPQKITGVRIGMDECREDAVIWLSLENGETAYAYTNENIETS